MPKITPKYLLAALIVGAIVLFVVPQVKSKVWTLQTLAGVILAFIGVAYAKALLEGRGTRVGPQQAAGGLISCPAAS